MKGEPLVIWASAHSTFLSVKMGVSNFFHNNMKIQHFIRIAELKGANSPSVGNPGRLSRLFRYINLLYMALIIAGCSSQDTSNNQSAQIHPVLGWILVGLFVVAWVIFGFFILWQIYDGIIKRDLSYTLGGVLGFFAGIIIGLLIDRTGGIAIGLAVIGMNLGGIILKQEIRATGFYAFIIGIIWIGIFVVYSVLSIAAIQGEWTLKIFNTSIFQ